MINILDKETINKIAAGEVVERPCSVVKELVENAIDAKANAITVEIKNGGKSLIRITDNGCGIASDEVKKAFFRHSTSKIKDANDLLYATTLGFRGEALSSISSVSCVQMLTKTRNELSGTRYVINGGVEEAFEAVGCPDGTTFIITDLFKFVPARKKFLKSDVTEAGYIGELIERISLSHPEITFKYINNSKTIIQTAGNNRLKDTIYALYGKEISSSLIEVSFKNDFIKLTGFIGKSQIARGNRSLENYYLNGRYVKSSIISKAIEDAYSKYLMSHKYPFTALHIEIPTDKVDVNVHPTKLEVRFDDNELIYNTIFTWISDALSNRSMIVNAYETRIKSIINPKKEDIIKPTPESFEINRNNKLSSDEKGEINNALNKVDIINDKEKNNKISNNNYSIKEALNEKERSIKTANDSVAINEVLVNKIITDNNKELKIDNRKIDLVNDNKMLNSNNSSLKIDELEGLKIKGQVSLFDEEREEKIKDYRIIGQVFLTYWLVEIDNMLYIIDQHAAHEKVIYEQILKKLNENNELLVQQISPPLIIKLTQKEEAILNANIDKIKALGFEIEPFGGSEYSLYGIPTNLPGVDDEEAIHQLIDIFGEYSITKAPQKVYANLATIACKAAVKGNNRITFIEAKELIDELMTLDNPFNCPHGRPVIISMSKSELERKFKR